MNLKETHLISRYDYENCDAESANKMMKEIEERFRSPQFVGTKFSSQNKEYVVKEADNYSYKDPVDNSIADKQVKHILYLSYLSEYF